MTPERWRQLKELFHAAVELAPAQRAGFLQTACAEDPGLREEVEALLANHDSGNDFLERRVYQATADLLESDFGELQPESRLGPYLVIRKIGEGGMGIVYLAQDTRLDRLVAIKALAARLTPQAQSLERLRLEAKAAARLTHPGIATVYALEEFGETLYIVYEYVRGATLLDELRRGPVRLPIVLDVGIKIAGALAAAHEQGIVHRDLKPENVIRTEKGDIKILDFGLARIENEQYKNGLLATRLTQVGAFLGTVAYSSPEQLLGFEVDFRTDIFSLGVLLYEMASGIHPFAAGDAVSSIARILEADPADLAKVSPGSPSEFDRILRRCLRKDPGQRYATTRELLADLESFRLRISNPSTWSDSYEIRKGARMNPLWWWQFHQACAGFGYYLMLYSFWKAKEWIPGFGGSLLLFAALLAVGISANLRLHLWFTSRFYPRELAVQLRRVRRWIRVGDILFASMLLAAAVAIHQFHAAVATLMVAVAIGSLVAFILIEPATARAAFGARD